MTYSVRNPFYLRISKNTVLPIYVRLCFDATNLRLFMHQCGQVYLDERHVDWMSDSILQHVLADLRPSLLDKLKAEAGEIPYSIAQQKATVDTHRGDTYQFCYFFRKTEPHSVLIKSRNFTLAPIQQRSSQKAKSYLTKKQNKRKKAQGPPTSTGRKRRKTNTRLPPKSIQDVEMADTSTDSGQDDDEFISDHEPETSDPERRLNVQLEVEEDEEKPKPIVGLTYQGFNIYGRCLCVVIEPWPMVRAASVAPSLALTKQTILQSTNQTPLFLPEEPEVEEILRPSQDGCSLINKAYLNRVLDPNDDVEDKDDMGGMMEFSQVLYNIGDSRAGAINDDEDADGAILFGDADEFREL